MQFLLDQKVHRLVSRTGLQDYEIQENVFSRLLRFKNNYSGLKDSRKWSSHVITDELHERFPKAQDLQQNTSRLMRLTMLTPCYKTQENFYSRLTGLNFIGFKNIVTLEVWDSIKCLLQLEKIQEIGSFR